MKTNIQVMPIFNHLLHSNREDMKTIYSFDPKYTCDQYEEMEGFKELINDRAYMWFNLDPEILDLMVLDPPKEQYV